MMACETDNSIHSTSSPPISFSVSPQRNPPDICFSCGKQGHWRKECPNKTAKKLYSASSSPSSFSGNNIVVRCHCGLRCVTLMSRTPKNPSRRFYKCPSDKCGLFKWCDELTVIEIPMCGCGAGFCSLNKESIGPGGRWYFACLIRKDWGACSFKQRVDLDVAVNQQQVQC